ncbi:hypothetical protein ATCC90586_002856 [Pythium insidiosum]|nr:hypothetical protein ATCC90586_002856 [Pythium insidiosum]
MQRVESVKRVELTKQDADALRSPEHVERDREWNEAVDGAWAEGRAPLTLLTSFLSHVQDEDLANAQLAAQQILALEPQNRLVKDLLEALAQQQALGKRDWQEQLESDAESDEEEEEEEEEEDEEEGTEEDEDEEQEEEEEEESPELGDEK